MGEENGTKHHGLSMVASTQGNSSSSSSSSSRISSHQWPIRCYRIMLKIIKNQLSTQPTWSISFISYAILLSTLSMLSLFEKEMHIHLERNEDRADMHKPTFPNHSSTYTNFSTKFLTFVETIIKLVNYIYPSDEEIHLRRFLYFWTKQEMNSLDVKILVWICFDAIISCMYRWWGSLDHEMIHCVCNCLKYDHCIITCPISEPLCSLIYMIGSW